jgi:long-chain acyl-CoA synthetase
MFINSASWQLLSFACASISVTIATAYDTLGEIGLTHALNEPECTGVFTNADLFPTLLKVLPNTSTVKFIIYDGTPKLELLEKLKAVRQNVTIITLDEARTRGERFSISPEEAKALLPKPSDVHCIMYTSGSMGTPKGVEITHANIAASVAGVYDAEGPQFLPDDTYLAFLPLAHIFEFCVELFLFVFGVTIGYGKIKTLTDASVRNSRGDFREFRPSIVIGVPAIFETIRKGILTKVNDGGMIKRIIFNGSYIIKKAGVPGLAQLVDRVVFSKVKAATGGRLRIAFTGSAALSRVTHEFLNVVLLDLFQGRQLAYAHTLNLTRSRFRDD